MAWVPLCGGGADLSQQTVEIDGRRERLTTKERDLLAYLAQNPGRTVTRRELLVRVWGHAENASEEPVYGAVKRLRAKIDRGSHRHVVSVHGDGYRFEPPSSTPGGHLGPQGASAGSSGFVGRAAELARVHATLARPDALVTFVGPGGAGKTRAAVELARERDAVFCDLGGVFTEERLFAGIAAALGVPLEGAAPEEWSASLRRAVAAKPGRILILDNVEQIVSSVTRLLASWSPRPSAIVCTSREPLGSPGEEVIAIGSLSREDAVALLSDRLVDADLADAEILSEIVDRVDRLPLAIELAAAQARVIGARALLDTLDCSLATLVSGSRDAPPRHASLRATVSWSWSLLGEREREVLGLLSVFEGPFQLRAARDVVGAPDAAALLAELCRRSLVERTGDHFRLFSAVRELAREHAGDLAQARGRHAVHFVGEGEQGAGLLDGPRHSAGAALLHEISAELWSALDHTREPALRARLALILDRALGLQLARGAARRAMLSGAREGLEDRDLACRLLCAEGRIEGAPADLLEAALSRAASPGQEAEVRLARAEVVGPRDPRAAIVELERAWELAARAAGPQLRGRIAARLGEALSQLGRVADATDWLRRALSLHIEAADLRGTARTSAALAHLVRLETGGDVARALLEDARRAADELGDPLVRARVLLDLGQHLTRTGDQAGARRALDEALAVYARVGFVRDGAMLHLHVAETLVGVGDLEGALREALATWSALGDDVATSTVCEAIGCIQLMRHELAEGERWIEEGLAAARRRSAARSECTLLGKRGLLHLVRGRLDSAWADFDEAVRKNEARGSTAIAGASLSDRAMASFALGRDAEAAADLARARELLHHPGAETNEGRMLLASEVLGRGFAGLERGEEPASVRETARVALTPVFSAPGSWDVVQRLIAWLVDALGDYGRAGRDASASGPGTLWPPPMKP
jgi:predicted ATPase/DNA-binding winged helix-turn-helix (wHTH) protein